MGEDGIRLNKFLSGAGICSRREADRRSGPEDKKGRNSCL